MYQRSILSLLTQISKLQQKSGASCTKALTSNPPWLFAVTILPLMSLVTFMNYPVLGKATVVHIRYDVAGLSATTRYRKVMANSHGQ